MTGTYSRADIEGAIKGATGDPASGAIHDWTPAIAQAIDELINGKPATENRIIKAKETRKADTEDN
jgi:hypothetical protein